MFHAMEIESGCNGLSPWIWTPLIPLHRLHGNLFQRKHLNGRSWLIFAYPPSVFGSDLKYHLIQHKQEPLHFHRGFACAQSPVSWGVEFAIKWVGEGFFLLLFPPKELCGGFFCQSKWLSFIHHSLVVTFLYLLPGSQIMWENRLQMRNYCRGMRRGEAFFVCQAFNDLLKAQRHEGWIISLNEFGKAVGYPDLTLFSVWNQSPEAELCLTTLLFLIPDCIGYETLWTLAFLKPCIPLEYF